MKLIKKKVEQCEGVVFTFEEIVNMALRGTDFSQFNVVVSGYRVELYPTNDNVVIDKAKQTVTISYNEDCGCSRDEMFTKI